MADVLYTVAEPTIIIESDVGTVNIIESILTGPQGAPGSAGNSIVNYPASIIIGGHRIVILNDLEKVEYADSTILSHANRIVGMSTGAAVTDANVTIQTYGEISEPSWNWILNTPIWLGVNGLMTQTPPTVGFSLIIGFPISSTKMFINFHEPIFLN